MNTKLKFEDLKGTTLKKLFNVKSVSKRYHNKHIDNSGNFGFTIIPFNNGSWFDLNGTYDKEHNLRGLELSFFGSWKEEEDNIYREMLNKLNTWINQITKERTEGNTYIETLKDGSEVTRIKQGVSKEESFKEFQKVASEGKVVCLSDLMINSGF